MTGTRNTGRLLTASLAIALLAGCSNSTGRRAQCASCDTHTDQASVISPVRVDPFATPRAGIASTSFSHPVKISVASPIPPISIYGDLPNTNATGQISRDSAVDYAGNVRQVTFAPEGADFDPAPAHDGSRIFFSSTRHRPTADIYVQTLGGTAVTQLTTDPAHDVMPCVSPDDSRVAFASNRSGSWDIYMMSAEGGQAIQITSDDANELHPSWSHDGAMLAYCRLSDASDRWEIWVTDVTKPASHTFLTYGLFPQWHPTENRILFQRSRDRGDRFFSLWTVDFNEGQTTAPTEVISSSVAAVINPCWSPDGRFIACATVFEPGGVGQTAGHGAPNSMPAHADIWVLSADGRARTNLTGGWRFNSMPSWGPNGEVFFVSDRAGAPTIWSLSPGQAMRVAGLANPENDPALAGAQENAGQD